MKLLNVFNLLSKVSEGAKTVKKLSASLDVIGDALKELNRLKAIWGNSETETETKTELKEVKDAGNV